MARITKSNAKGERVLTLRELNRALLERQLLLTPQRLTLPRAIERLCALQAQYAPSPYIALWSRVTGFRKEQLTRALEDRKAVKSTLFRITLHITSARDYPYYAAAWLPAAREMTPRVTVERMAELSRRVHAAAQRQITHEQLEAIAAEDMGGRWRTRTLAPLLHVPPAGTWGFHGRPELLVLEAWLGAGPLPAGVGFVAACVRATGTHAHPPREIPQHRDSEERRRSSHGAGRRLRRGDVERRQKARSRGRAATAAHEGGTRGDRRGRRATRQVRALLEVWCEIRLPPEGAPDQVGRC